MYSMSPEAADAQDDVPFEDELRILRALLREASKETLITYLFTNDSARDDMREHFAAKITRTYWDEQAETERTARADEWRRIYNDDSGPRQLLEDR